MCNWLKKLFGIKETCENCHHCDNCGDKHENHDIENTIGAQTTEVKVEPIKTENTEKVQ